jgi:Na+/proline symporter
VGGRSDGTALILSLYWTRTNITGVVAGMATGTLTTILWKIFLKDATGVYELIRAFFWALGAIALFGLLGRNERGAPAAQNAGESSARPE